MNTDYEIEEKVMGKVMLSQKEMKEEAEKVWKEQPNAIHFLKGFYYDSIDEVFKQKVSRYSTDIKSAFKVIDRLRELEILTCLAVDSRGVWTCQLAKPDGSINYICGTSLNPSMAICNAALNFFKKEKK